MLVTLCLLKARVGRVVPYRSVPKDMEEEPARPLTPMKKQRRLTAKKKRKIEQYGEKRKENNSQHTNSGYLPASKG